MARLRVVLASAAVLFLGLAIPMKASAFDYAPINCSKAGPAAEVAVCRTYSLGQAEARMSTLYGTATALVAMGQRGAIADDQVRWLSVREACGGAGSCLGVGYPKRVGGVTRLPYGNVARGPL